MSTMQRLTNSKVRITFKDILQDYLNFRRSYYYYGEKYLFPSMYAKKEDPIDPKSFSMKKFIMKFINKELPDLDELGVSNNKLLFFLVKVFWSYIVWMLIIKKPLYRFLRLDDLSKLKPREGMIEEKNIVATTSIRDSQHDYQRERFNHKLSNWQ